MRTLVKIIAVIMALAITTCFIGFMMDWSMTRYALPVNIILFVILLASAIYNNYLENKKFRQFLVDVKQDRAFINGNDRPSKAPDEKSRLNSGEYSHYKTRKSGLSWSAGTVHGAVPKRGEKRKFLSRR